MTASHVPRPGVDGTIAAAPVSVTKRREGAHEDRLSRRRHALLGLAERDLEPEMGGRAR
jgi:hypothetical protein